MFTRVVSISVMLVALSLGCVTTVRADTITLNAVDSGWYDQTGFHNMTSTNYFAGRSGLPPGLVHRNFLVFDLSGVVPGTITSATLRLFNPGYVGPDPTETYTVYDATTPIPQLVAGGTGRTDIFADLGSGMVYGSTTVSAADNNRIVTFSLNAAALADLNNAGGLFAIGGAITTLGAGTAPEGVFGFTGGTANVRQLVLEAAPVPEPATVILLSAGVVGVAAAVRRRRQAQKSEDG